MDPPSVSILLSAEFTHSETELYSISKKNTSPKIKQPDDFLRKKRNEISNLLIFCIHDQNKAYRQIELLVTK